MSENDAMSSNQHGPNVIEINGMAMLLTTTSGGVAIHLTAPAPEPSSGREAVLDFYFASDRYDRADALAGYDRAALTEPRWSPTTLCGRVWAIMVGGDGGAIGRSGEVAFAPTCRRCLTLIDRHFPKPTPDSRLALVAQIAADTVVEQRGFAEIHHVPGDQQDELRRTIRALIRQRTSHPVRTHLIKEVIYVECPAIHDQHAEQGMREAAEVMGAILSGEPPPRLKRDWVISWATWDIA
ncbi:hypothetical protein [Phytohabitans flavus]|uniref:hypothetical protein n=1 Tax=Phytohabitans flavus TaxID=1076124 RepID=UPI001E512C43|nr:hypothetical protein [Phytohabitans flavus]